MTLILRVFYDMKNLTLTALACSLGLFMAGCSSLSDYETLPSLTITDCSFDTSDRTHPVIAVPYCINNPLDISADVARVHFSYKANGLTVYEENRNLDESVDKFGSFCETRRVTLDAENDPKAASTVLNTMLSRTCEIKAVMYFDDKEAKPVSADFKKVIK